MSSLHQSATVIDGLIVSKWSREVFADMQRGGLTAANCTCSIWEGLRDTMLNIARWKQYFREHADLILPVRRTADIRAAKESGRVGIILGFQNTAGIEDRLDLLEGSVAKIVKLEHAWRRLDGRNDDGFQVAPFPG